MSGFGQLGTLVGFLRQKIIGTPYRHELFRVGMTVTIDPTPFLLAGSALTVKPPVATGGSMMTSVVAVGDVADGALHTTRLHLPESGAFLHLMIDGERVLECRYFSQLDAVEPASEDEWGFWLDPDDGMIGFPEFQTKDGRIYRRHWAPGETRIEPRALTESVRDAKGAGTVAHQAMLYARATDLADPAPQAEYLLVEAIEQNGAAWVDLRVGIDLNPASLSLA